MTLDGSTALLSDVTYDASTAMMTQWRTPTGLAAPYSVVQHSVTVDGYRPRPKKITAKIGADPAFFDTGDYTYDKAGNITLIAGSGVTARWEYGYDALSRLTSARRGASSTTYMAYDDFGNLTLHEGAPLTVDAATNRLAGAFTYDSLGNMTSEQVGDWTRHLRWDPENRLLAAWADGGANPPAASYAFAYDTSGERVLKYALSGGQVSRAELYIRDEGGNVLSDFLWVPEAPGAVTGYWSRTADHVYLGRNELVKIERPEGTGEQWLTSLVHDHLGSTRVEVASTASMSKIDYRPYGGIAWTAPTSPALTNNARYFTGHEREYAGSEPLADVLTGLDYMHARYFNLNLGRFLSVDSEKRTQGLSTSWHRLFYASNNPISFVDSDGKASDWAIGVNVFNSSDTVVTWQSEITPEQRAVDMAIMVPFTAAVALPLLGFSAPGIVSEGLALAAARTAAVGLTVGAATELMSDHPADTKVRNTLYSAGVASVAGPLSGPLAAGLGRLMDLGRAVLLSEIVAGVAAASVEAGLKGPIDGEAVAGIAGSGTNVAAASMLPKALPPRYRILAQHVILFLLEVNKNRMLQDASYVEPAPAEPAKTKE